MRRNQASYLAGQTFEEAVAFIAGGNESSDRLLLAGFQEWLLVRTKDRPEVAWPGHVAHLTFTDEPDRWSTSGLSDEERDTLREGLFDLLDDFLIERANAAGWRPSATTT